MSYQQPEGAFVTISTSSRNDAVLSPDGKIIFATFSFNGPPSIVGFDVQSGLAVETWQFSGVAIDVSPDGRYLVAVGSSLVQILDRQTGVIETFNHEASGAIFHDVSFLSDGNLLLTQWKFRASTAPITVLDISTGVFFDSTESYAINGVLTATPDRTQVAIGPIEAYNLESMLVYTVGEGISATNSNYASTPSQNVGSQAISATGDLIAQGSNINVYDRDLGLITSLADQYPELKNVAGLAFSPDGDFLYILESVARAVFVVETGTWDLKGAYYLNEPIPTLFDSGNKRGNGLQVSQDGSSLLIYGDGKLIAVDLSAGLLQGGTNADNHLVGTPDRDVLYGFDGDDTIDPAWGADSILAGDGNDIVRFSTTRPYGLPSTSANASGGAGIDTFDLSIMDSHVFYSGGSILFGQLQYNLSQFERVILGSGDDTAYVYGAEVHVATGSGADAASLTNGSISLEAGNDSLTLASSTGGNGLADGGEGSDILRVTQGFFVDLLAGTAITETASYTLINFEDVQAEGGYSPLTVYGDYGVNRLSVLSTNWLGVTFDGRGGDDYLSGSAAADILIGGSGDDVLFGGADNDLLVGGAGSDNLTGGAGSDTFAFAGGAGHDRILDFSIAQRDRLDFSEAPGVQGPAELHATQVGTDVLLSLGRGTSVTLVNMTLASFASANITYSTLPALSQSDHNANHTANPIWRHDDGTIVIWRQNGVPGGFDGQTVAGVPTDYRIEQAGDFNGDGDTDIVLRHTDGSVIVWHSTATLGGFTAQYIDGITNDWQIEDAGDFNGDGKSDLAWRHSDGTVILWHSTAEAGGYTGQTIAGISTAWGLQQTEDFNGDGKDDLLWRHEDGTALIWHSTAEPGGFTAQYIEGIANAWQIEQAADFNGDGKGDILWRHKSGDVMIWNSTAEPGGYTAQDIVGIGLEWRIQHTADINGDGKADIVWRHDDGTALIWNSNGIPGGYDGQDIVGISPDFQLI